MKNKKGPIKGKQPSPANGSWLLRAHVCKLLQGMTAVESLRRSAGGNSNNKDAVGKVRSSVLAERSYSVLTLMWFASHPREGDVNCSFSSVYTGRKKANRLTWTFKPRSNKNKAERSTRRTLSRDKDPTTL